MDKRLKNVLTKEEKMKQTFELARAREKMIKDIYEQNRKIQEYNEIILEKIENTEPEYVEEEQFLFFDFAHPFTSLFANIFANR